MFSSSSCPLDSSCPADENVAATAPQKSYTKSKTLNQHIINSSLEIEKMKREYSLSKNILLEVKIEIQKVVLDYNIREAKDFDEKFGYLAPFFAQKNNVKIFSRKTFLTGGMGKPHIGVTMRRSECV